MKTKKKTLLRAKGRRENPLELCDCVLSDYHTTRASLSDIAQINKVSPPVVSKIVEEDYYFQMKDNFGTPRLFTVRWDDEIKDCVVDHHGVSLKMSYVRKNYKF